LLSIAGVYRTSDAPFPKEVAGKAAQVWLVGDKLVMLAL
jgi:septum site-determining protein MinC